MPDVTVPSRPSGAPIATTTSPTRTWSESPRGSVGRSLRYTLTIARSYDGLVPMTLPGLRSPSGKTTSRPSDDATLTTWLLVRM